MVTSRVHILFLVFAFLIIQSRLLATTYGSDSAVSIVNPMNIPTAADNIIKTFACAKNGFGFQDLNTSCSFQSTFPISGPINLKGGKLYLQSDLILNNTGSLADLGSIKGANHVVDLSEYMQNFAYGTNPTGAITLSLVARVTEVSTLRAIDWSYDSQYVAVIKLKSNKGNELQVYSFDGAALTARAALSLPGDGYCVRWHPSTYYLGTSQSNGNIIRAILFNPTTNTLTEMSNQNPTGPLYAVSWGGRGKYLAAGGASIYAFPFNASTGVLSAAVTPTNNAALNGTVNYACIRCAPAGSKDDVIAGTSGGSLHLYNFTGTALNHLKRYDYGTAITSLDWARTSTFIALGLTNGSIKTYQHTAASNLISYKNVNSSTAATVVRGVSFKPNGSELVACYDLYSGSEFIVYGFNQSTYALNQRYPIDVSTSCFGVRYSNGTGNYIARIDQTNNFVSIYKENYNPFIFENVKIFMNSGITLGSALTFSGNCAINGRGNKLTLTGDGNINIAPRSSLEIKLTDLNFKSPNAFGLQGSTSKLVFRNSNILLGSDVVVGDGALDVYEDLVVTGPYKFQLATGYTTTIHSNSTLTFENGAEFKVGKTRATTVPPVYFEDKSAQLDFDSATWHITNSGMALLRGIVNVYGESKLDIDYTDTYVSSTMQGLVLGDGVRISNDPFIMLHGNGTRLSVDGGAIVLDPATTFSMVQFYGEPKLSVATTTTIYFKRPITSMDGWFETSTSAKLVLDSGAYFTLNNTRFSELNSATDFMFTGSAASALFLNLDKNDSINLMSGSLFRVLSIFQDGNVLTGKGSFTGIINYVSSLSQLTWDLPSKLNSDLDLKGGKIIFTQDSGFLNGYSLKGSGTVDLTTHIFELGADSATTWNSNIYWIGNGSTLRLLSDVILDGIWTFSGLVIIDGAQQSIYFGNNARMVLERGAQVILRNVLIGNISSAHGIICSDNNCQITLDFSDLGLSGDYLFDKGSLYLYNDSTIRAADDLDVLYTFSYASTQPTLIDTMCFLSIYDRIRFSIGRQNSSIIDPDLQPLTFFDASSSLVLNGGTLHITSSGMIMNRGILDIVNSSNLEIENESYPYGLMLGNGVLADDFELKLRAGVELALKSGKLFYNNYNNDRIVFGSTESALAIQTLGGLASQRNILLNNGSITTPLASDIFLTRNPNIFVTAFNLHRYDYAHNMDYFVTGTLMVDPYRMLVLDSDDQLLVNPGNLMVDFSVKEYGNLLTGIGSISSAVVFTDWRSTLTWDIPQVYGTNDIDLKGGKIIYTQDSGLDNGYTFKGSGTVDFSNHIFELGKYPTTWDSNIYWVADNAILKMNGDVLLSGIWTFSGITIVDGSGYTLDLSPSGSIILERGAQVEFKNVALYNLSRNNCITCLDDNCVITLNWSDMSLAGDYLFDKGCLYIYYDSDIQTCNGWDRMYTFSYTSVVPALVEGNCIFEVPQGVRLSIGRYDSTVTDTTMQPILFSDPITSKLVLSGGTLHVTSSGMIMTQGVLEVRDSSELEIENSKYPYGLILGEGTTADSDFKIELDAGVQLTMKSGKLFYNNYADDKIVFDSNESTIRIESENGLTAMRDLTLLDGRMEFPTSSSYLDYYSGVSLIHKNFIHQHDSPYLVHKITAHGIEPFYLQNRDSFVILEGSDASTLISSSGTSYFGGIGGYSGNISLRNGSATLVSTLQTPYTQDLALNGGTLMAAVDMSFATDKIITGSGRVQLVGVNAIFGLSSDTNITHTIFWQGLTKGGIELNAQRTSLSGTWTFGGSINLNGNGNILDLSNMGVLTIRPNSTLSLENLSLKGLGQGLGSINFMDDTSVLKMSNVYLELDNNMTTTIGGVYIGAPSIVGLKNYDWTLDQNASMTIDGATLWQDPLDQTNHGRIKFGTGSIGKYLTLVSSGTIKTMANLDTISTQSGYESDLVRQNSNSVVRLSDNFISVNDAKFYVAKNITGNTTLSGQSMILSSINLSGGTLALGADAILDSQSTIESSGNFDLSGHSVMLDGYLQIPNGVRIKVISSGIIDGQNNILDMNTTGKLLIDTGVTLTLRNMNWKGKGSWPVEMRSNTSKLVLENLATGFDRDFTFSQGQMFISGDVIVTGTGKFSYASTATSYIQRHSTLCFDKNTTFSYSPRLTGRHTLSERSLISMIDKTSEIFFDQCTLQLPDSGWRLTRGTIYFDNKVTLNANTTAANAFEWGDGTVEGEVDVNMLSGANIENSGYISYNPGS